MKDGGFAIDSMYNIWYKIYTVNSVYVSKATNTHIFHYICQRLCASIYMYECSIYVMPMYVLCVFLPDSEYSSQ